jgi:hypothetical protein
MPFPVRTDAIDRFGEYLVLPDKNCPIAECLRVIARCQEISGEKHGENFVFTYPAATIELRQRSPGVNPEGTQSYLKRR